MRSRGLHWLTDEHAQDASPFVQRFDSGSDRIASLKHISNVRAVALRGLSRAAIRPTAPLSELRDTLFPVYILHMYEVRATAAMLGGIDFESSLRDGRGPSIVPPDQQRAALRAVLESLSAESLAVPESLLALMTPRPSGYDAPVDSFRGSTGVAFDAVAPAQTAARMIVGYLFDPRRSARLIEYHARDSRQLSLAELVNETVERNWKNPSGKGFNALVQRSTARVVLDALLAASVDPQQSMQARAVYWASIQDLKAWIVRQKTKAQSGWREDYALALVDIDRAERGIPPVRPAQSPDLLYLPIGMAE